VERLIAGIIARNGGDKVGIAGQSPTPNAVATTDAGKARKVSKDVN
jgi:hypothetical protein